jgi:hypothetical protein
MGLQSCCLFVSSKANSIDKYDQFEKLVALEILGETSLPSDQVVRPGVPRSLFRHGQIAAAQPLIKTTPARRRGCSEP